MELEAAIFDFGGVLTTSISASFKEYERALELPDGTLLQAFLNDMAGDTPAFHLLEKGLISEEEFYRRMYARICTIVGHEEISWPEDPGAVRRGLFGKIQRNERMIEAAVRIAAFYKTAILSNNVKEWTDWRDMASAHLFDLVIDSSEVGLRKPDPEIYALTCERLGVDPTRAAFVDDILENVEGAKAVGLHAIHFTTNDEVLAALERHFPRAFADLEIADA